MVSNRGCLPANLIHRRAERVGTPVPRRPPVPMFSANEEISVSSLFWGRPGSRHGSTDYAGGRLGTGAPTLARWIGADATARCSHLLNSRLHFAVGEVQREHIVFLQAGFARDNIPVAVAGDGVTAL